MLPTLSSGLIRVRRRNKASGERRWLRVHLVSCCGALERTLVCTTLTKKKMSKKC